MCTKSGLVTVVMGAGDSGLCEAREGPQARLSGCSSTSGSPQAAGAQGGRKAGPQGS